MNSIDERIEQCKTIISLFNLTAQEFTEKYKDMTQQIMIYLYGDITLRDVATLRLWDTIKTTPARKYWINQSYRMHGIEWVNVNLDINDSEKICIMAEILGQKNSEN